MSCKQTNTCAAVTHTLSHTQIANPCRKGRGAPRTAMSFAHITKIAIHRNGSTLDGMKNTVPTAMARPNSESCSTRRQFIAVSRESRSPPPLDVSGFFTPEQMRAAFAAVAERDAFARGRAVEAVERLETALRGIEIETLHLHFRPRAADRTRNAADVENENLWLGVRR